MELIHRYQHFCGKNLTPHIIPEAALRHYTPGFINWQSGATFTDKPLEAKGTQRLCCSFGLAAHFSWARLLVEIVNGVRCFSFWQVHRINRQQNT